MYRSKFNKEETYIGKVGHKNVEMLQNEERWSCLIHFE